LRVDVATNYVPYMRRAAIGSNAEGG